MRSFCSGLLWGVLLTFLSFSKLYAATIRELNENPIHGANYTLISPSTYFGSTAKEQIEPRKRSKSDVKEATQWAFENGLALDGALSFEDTHFRAAWEGLQSARIIEISGEIVRGDLKKLKQLVEASGFSDCLRQNYCPFNNIISLNSPGGSLSEALAIGEYIASQNFITFIDDSAVCESACALAFLGGYTNYEGFFFPRRFLHSNGKLGIHQPYFQLPSGQYSSEQVDQVVRVLNQSVNETTNYLLKAGGSLGFLKSMYATSSSDMRYINVIEAANLGVYVIGARQGVYEISRRQMLSYCANQYLAKYSVLHPELLQNLQATETSLLTFVSGKEFFCAAFFKSNGTGWTASVCFEQEKQRCSLAIGQGDLFNMKPQPTDPALWDIAVDVDNGTLGYAFKAMRHRSALMSYIKLAAEQNYYASFRDLMSVELEAPMPTQYCGQIDGYHPKLMLTIQQRLNALGIDVGRPDGSAGPNTQKGIIRANARFIGRETETIDTQLMVKLGIDESVLAEFDLCGPT